MINKFKPYYYFRIYRFMYKEFDFLSKNKYRLKDIG